MPARRPGVSASAQVVSLYLLAVSASMTLVLAVRQPGHVAWWSAAAFFVSAALKHGVPLLTAGRARIDAALRALGALGAAVGHALAAPVSSLRARGTRALV